MNVVYGQTRFQQSLRAQCGPINRVVTDAFTMLQSRQLQQLADHMGGAINATGGPDQCFFTGFGTLTALCQFQLQAGGGQRGAQFMRRIGCKTLFTGDGVFHVRE